MYEMIKRLYINGKLTEVGLDSAVARGWISLQQKKEIVGR